MKKIRTAFIALLVMGLGVATVNAQDKPAATTPTKDASAKPKADSKPSTSGQHLKKDGTPDMRYKENKGTATKPAASEKKTAPAKSEKKAEAAKPATSDKKSTPPTKSGRKKAPAAADKSAK